VADITGVLNQAYDEVNRDIGSHTPDQFRKRYEIEMSKALLTTLGAFSIPVPVDQVQLRRNELVTRLPALALWMLFIGNALFAFLAVVITIYAFRSGSAEVHQCQIRLSFAGLASQLFSPDTAQQTAKNDFDLFHKRHSEDDTSTPDSAIEVHSSLSGGAMFVLVNRTTFEERQARTEIVD